MSRSCLLSTHVDDHRRRRDCVSVWAERIDASYSSPQLLAWRGRNGVSMLIRGYEHGNGSTTLRFSRRGCRFADDEFGGENVVVDVFFVGEPDQDVAGGSAECDAALS